MGRVPPPRGASPGPNAIFPTVCTLKQVLEQAQALHVISLQSAGTDCKMQIITCWGTGNMVC